MSEYDQPRANFASYGQRDPTTPHSDSPNYRRWRALIPWDDETIARALENRAERETGSVRRQTSEDYRSMARHLRTTGRLSASMVRLVREDLVTTCGVEGCRAKALYIQGLVEGRCQQHRLVLPALAWRQIADRTQALSAPRRAARDRFLRARDEARRMALNSK